ncbi:LacI family DNA-binding transcriptional regulator [Arsukibacterium sp.]|uniref:LacI family DNA-binding transcriptional regulator n=1 Tax=Arsukibacterium sp. TaxID=1977258 RepID=UPI001BD26958|nr:LacI family DNA-binding transcriptional regulator [Arsukibacterium sp.]
MQKKLTLKAVAKHLGVSVATVSNAYNRPDQLSAGLRQKILRQCEELGYQGPNAAARSLRTGRSGIIAILLSDTLEYSFTDPVASQFVQGVAQVLEQHGQDLLLLSSQHDTQSSSAEAVPDGFILYGVPHSDAQLTRILQQNKPVVAVDFDLPGYVSVNIDNYKAALQCALHAMRQRSGKVSVLGLRLIDSDRVCRIQHDELYSSDASISRRRLEGYLAAASQLKRDLPASQIWQIPKNTLHFARIAAYEALSQHPLPSVILCMSDVIALAALAAARELGINIPEQLVVVGFDGIAEGERSVPTLSTVQQFSTDKGRKAAQKLLNADLTDNEIMPSELIIRQSC